MAYTCNYSAQLFFAAREINRTVASDQHGSFVLTKMVNYENQISLFHQSDCLPSPATSIRADRMFCKVVHIS